ncbi:MAG TPA: dienelactone hydrolase family protein [Tepidisphaeraceae bacterium]|nr:dienelactone hydrolase family protein [Tepidisphaeraceae bacterium]
MLTAGPQLDRAVATILLIHGRGASPEDMIELYEELNVPHCAALAPEAAGRTWYPHSFLAPLEANQPYLDSALNRIESIVAELLSRNIPSSRIALLGFSQGACLTLEFAARHPRVYGAVIGFTGGLIGPAGTDRDYPGSLAGTPVFLGAGDPDPHVPFERVLETEQTFKKMGAAVELRRYPGLPHTINRDEFDAARALIERLAPAERN